MSQPHRPLDFAIELRIRSFERANRSIFGVSIRLPSRFQSCHLRNNPTRLPPDPWSRNPTHVQ